MTRQTKWIIRLAALAIGIVIGHYAYVWTHPQLPTADQIQSCIRTDGCNLDELLRRLRK